MPVVDRRTVIVATSGALAALVPAALLRGFTVDDALITARYAAHLARGLGYRFNAAGAVTDGVTPLGFPYLLAPFARGGPLAAILWGNDAKNLQPRLGRQLLDRVHE